MGATVTAAEEEEADKSGVPTRGRVLDGHGTSTMSGEGGTDSTMVVWHACACGDGRTGWDGRCQNGHFDPPALQQKRHPPYEKEKAQIVLSQENCERNKSYFVMKLR